MDWKRILAYISGSVDQELLLRNEYLATENRILRNQIPGRLLLNDSDRMTLADTGFLRGCKYLLHDRDTKFCSTFDAILEAVGIQAIKLPPLSPNLNAYCEHWIWSLKTELLSKMILIGERSLRDCLENYVAHFHAKRNHQGKDNVILFPEPEDHLGESAGPIQTRERLGGLLKFYYREAG